jgi:flagellar hook-associated protein 2
MGTGVSFAGLSSGIDTGQIIEQLMAIERRPITLLENQQAREETKLQMLQAINTSLLSSLNAAEALSDESTFDVFGVSSSDSDIVSATVGEGATPGTFSVEVLSLATSQVRSSGSFSSASDALGFEGDIVINGTALSIKTGDSLDEIQETINSASTGVQAQILQVSDTDHRLLLTSDTTGADGFSLQDASSTDVLQSLGFTGTSTSVKNGITGGAQTDQMDSSSTAVGSLIGLSNTVSGTVTVGDETVAIDLSTMSLTDIKDAIDAAAPTGVTTSIVSEEEDETTVFRLQIDGTTTFVDDGNVLETLGVLQGAAEVVPAVAEAHTGNVANTTDGSTPVTANAKFNQIFGASASNNDTISISGTTSDGTAVSGSYTIAAVNSDRVSDLITEIESVFNNSVTASVDASGKLVVTDNAPGESQLSVAIQANNEGGGSLSFGSFSASTEGEASQSREVVAGQDATFRLNGVTLSRSTNTVDDALDGVTLDLNKAEVGTMASVSVSRDTTAIRGSIETFVTAYNEAMTLIDGQFDYDEDTETAGPLSGDATLLALQSRLRSVLTDQVSGLSDGENNLTLFGISFTRTGQLEIDGAKLDSALNTDLSALKRVFIAEGSTSDTDVELVFQSDQTSSGTYDISITTAPEQAVLAGSLDLSGGLAGAETLTITDLLTERSESIDLEAGDDTDEIVTKINNTLSSSVAEVRTGSEVNTTDGVTPVTSATTFDSINGAGTVADDTIDIQATLHSGERVSGSFTISDPATQTVGDLLSEIRSVMQGTVSATVDTNGQIVVTDNQVGNSEITLVLIERNEGGGSLNFGSIDATTEGRFSVGITASNDGGNLVLTADAYGAEGGFTVSQTSNETGMADGTYNGVDVAGTINGESTTGAGRILTGDNEAATIAGLSLRVLLTPTQLAAQGADQGTIKLTHGVAEQLRRSLESITDPFDGLVKTRETAVQDTIDAAQSQIDAMLDRLALKESTMLRQFTAMETAIAELNSTGSFLNSQLASLSAGA